MDDASATWAIRRARLNEAHTAFVAAVASVPPSARGKSGACGEWSPVQVIHHAAGWNVEAVERIAVVLADPATPEVAYDDDAFNAAVVEARRGLGWDETLADLGASFAALSTAADALSPDEVAGDGRFAEWIDGRADDYLEHAGQLRAWKAAALTPGPSPVRGRGETRPQ